MGDAQTQDYHMENMEEKKRGCKHYERGCCFISPCCQKVFSCRLCHDEAIMDHSLDRHSVTCIVCSLCHTKQDVSNRYVGL